MTEYSPQWKEKVQPGIYAVRDMEYFQGIYPQRIKELQEYVVQQCNAMDYSGSPIYDEYPEALMIEQACKAVYERISQSWFTEEEEEKETETEEQSIQEEGVEAMSRPWGPPPGGRPPQGPPPGNPPHDNWLSDIIKVLFMNELQRRRCRMGKC